MVVNSEITKQDLEMRLKRLSKYSDLLKLNIKKKVKKSEEEKQ